MSEDKAALADRLSSLKPGKPKTSGVNMLAVVGMTALAGVGLGAAAVAFWPQADQAVDAIATSEGTEFPTGTGLDGFRVTDKGDANGAQTMPVMRSVSSRKEAELAEQLAKAKADLEALQNASPEAEDTSSLQQELDSTKADLEAQKAAQQALEDENTSLRAEIESKGLFDTQAAAEAEAKAQRAEELARLRSEKEAIATAQINSDMIAYKGGNSESETITNGAGSHGSGATAFIDAGAKAAEVQQAEVIANPSRTIVQGTLIEAALETAIDTSLPGNVAAMVSHDVWSFDMSQVVIPRGSKLYGRYDNEINVGQKRVLIAWDRIVTTDGQSVNIAAYGTDRMGRSGLPGKVRSHFLQRFGSATLVSVIGALPAAASANISNKTTADTVNDAGTGLSESVGDIMADYLGIPPTISVNQGGVVMIRVDTDLEFF